MLNDFISKVKLTGLARTNRYRVSIATPTLMINTINTGRLITLFCESTTLPGQVIATSEQRIDGETREFYYKKLYNNVSMSFYIDNNFEVKRFFDIWTNSILNTKNKIVSYYKDYIAPTINIDVLPVESDIATYSMTLYEAYPNNVYPIKLSADSREVAMIGVNFTYKYYITSHANPTQQL